MKLKGNWRQIADWQMRFDLTELSYGWILYASAILVSLRQAPFQKRLAKP